MEEENKQGMLTDEQKHEITEAVIEGFTSGRLDSEDGTKVAWELKNKN